MEAHEPDQDELQFYKQLEKGFECGVHDEDFLEPLEGTLHIVHGLRCMLRLDCEDETLKITQPCAQVRAEVRSGVAAGLGVALISAVDGGGERDLVIIIPANEDERCLLVSVVERLRVNPRSLRQERRGHGARLGCFPVCGRIVTGCVSASGRRQRHPSVSECPPSMAAETGEPAAPLSSPLDDPMGGPGQSSSDACPNSSGARRRSSSSGSAVPERTVPGLDTARAHALALWQAEVLRVPGPTPAARRSFSIPRTRLRGSSTRSLDITSPKHAKDSAEDEVDSTGLMPDPVSPSAFDGGGQLGPASCAALLHEFLLRGSVGDHLDGQDSGFLEGLFRDDAPDAACGIAFPAFWDICVQLLLVGELQSIKEEVLETKWQQNGAHVLTLSDWEWFSVMVQDEQREVVEKVEALLGAMREPDVDGSGRLTMYGLSRHLCSPENAIFSPHRCVLHQDMSRPLTDYWIASTHHVYTDASVQQVSETCGSKVSEQGLLRPFYAALRSSYRCIGLTLVMGSSVGDLHVLMQRGRAPLEAVLRVINEPSMNGDTAYPLLLVLYMGLLQPASCAAVPAMLEACLGGMLWKSSGSLPPSPQDARGHVIVVTAPTSGMQDAELAPEPPPALRRLSTICSGGGEAAEEVDALEAWQGAAKSFALWPGSTFDTCAVVQGRPPDLPPPTDGEPKFSVGFLPSDMLQSLEVVKPQELVEYHRERMTLAYPVAPRSAPTNFNPAAAWGTGVQIAALALNFDRRDGAILAHLGRFAQENGGCGYVLKPKHLRAEDPDHSPSAATVPTPVRLELRIIAARALPGIGGRTSPMGPTSVAVSVWGCSGDCQRHVSRPALPTGYAVSWADGPAQIMTFPIDMPSAAVVAFELLEFASITGAPAGPRRLAAFAAPADGLRVGYRWVPLWTVEGGEALPTMYNQLCGLLVKCVVKAERRCASRASTALLAGEDFQRSHQVPPLC